MSPDPHYVEEPLFDGDTGDLSLPARRALIGLLKKRFVAGELDKELWAAVSEHREVIEPRLNELFFELHIFDAHQVAYKVEVGDLTEKFPRLVKEPQNTYKKYETIALFVIRQTLRQQGLDGKPVYVSRGELIDQIKSYVSPDETNMAEQTKKIGNAIESVREMGFLVRPRRRNSDTEGHNLDADLVRYRIPRAVEAIISLEQLQTLAETLSGYIDNAATDEEGPLDD